MVTADRWRARAEAVRARIALSSVVGRAVKLSKSGNEWDGLCPFHADRRVGSFKVNDAKGIFKCFACGASGDHFTFLERHRGMRFTEAVEALERDAGLDGLAWQEPARLAEMEAARAAREAAAAADTEKRRARGRALWFNSDAIIGTPAAAYLCGRGITVGPDGLARWPSSLRYRPDLYCGESRDKGGPEKLPGMVAGVWHLDGSLLGCHRTFLDISGWDHRRKSGPVAKARLADAKLTLGPTLGGYIPLNKGRHACALKDIPEGTDIYLSEGIEDGLSVAMGRPDLRIIAGVSLSKLGSVMLPDQMGALVLIMQRDAADSAAAEAVERAIAQHQRAGRRVKMLWPPDGFKDWNDWLTGKPMASAE